MPKLEMGSAISQTTKKPDSKDLNVSELFKLPCLLFKLPLLKISN